VDGRDERGDWDPLHSRHPAPLFAAAPFHQAWLLSVVVGGA